MPSYRGKITAPRSADAEMIDVSSEYEFEPIPQDEGLVDVSAQYRDEGTWESLKSGVAKGILGLSEMGGTAAQYIGGRIGSETLQKVGQASREHVQGFSERYDPSEKIQGDIVEKPELLKDPAWWAYNVGQTGTSILPGIATGVISGGIIGPHLKIAGEAFRWSPKLVNALARIGTALPAGVVGGAQEGASTYDEMIKKGADEATAARGAEMMTLASAALNAISFDQMLKTGTGVKGKALLNFLKRGAVAGSTEAVTEYLEEPAEVAIKRTLTPDKFSEEEAKKQLISGVNVMPPSFVIGLLTGGIAGNIRKEGSKPYSDAVQQVTQDGTLEQTTDEELKTLKDNTEVLKKRRSFDKGLQEAAAKVDAEVEKRSAFPPLPQDFFDQMGSFLEAGQDKAGAPFSVEHVKSFRDQYAANPKANPESLAKLDEFIDNSEIKEIATPSDEPTILMHSLRADLMQGLPIDQAIEKGNEIKGRHPKLADDINKLIIEFQGKKVPGVAAPVQTEAQAPVIPPVEAAAPPTGVAPAPEEIAPPAPAGEAVAPLEIPEAEAPEPERAKETLDLNARIDELGNQGKSAKEIADAIKAEHPEVDADEVRQTAIGRMMSGFFEGDRAPVKTKEKTEPAPPKKEGVSKELKSLILHDMRTALEEGHKYGMRDDETAGTGSNVTPIGTTNPPWLMDIIREMKRKHQQTVGKSEILAVIRRELEGKDFSPKQMKIWFLIEDHLQNESANPHYTRAEEAMSGAVDALAEDYNEGAAIGQYNDSDLEFPPTQKEVAQAAAEVVGEEYAKGNTDRLQTYQAERGEAHQEENEAPTAESRAEEVTPKTEKTQPVMTRDEFRLSQNRPYYDAILAAIKEGEKVSVATQYVTIPLSKPEHIRITKSGTVQVPQGSKWVSLTEGQVESLARQAGAEVPTLENKVFYTDYLENLKTEPTKAGTQAVIPGASEAETFMLTGAPGEVGQAAPKGKAQETATIEEVAGEMEKEPTPAEYPKRFEIGKALTKDQRKKVLDSLVDVYKLKGNDKVPKGVDREGNDIIGWKYSPELFEKSDVTGMMVRYYVTLPDGKIAHPSELFPDMTQSKIDAQLEAIKYAEKQKKAAEKDKERRIVPAGEDQKAQANQLYHRTNRKIEGSYFAEDDKGNIVRVDGKDKDDVAFWEARGFKRTTEPAKDVMAEKPAPKPKKEKPPAKAEKQPWEMTKEEWQQAIDEAKINFTGTGGESKYGMGRTTKEGSFNTGIERRKFLRYGMPDKHIEGLQIPAQHFDVVQKAISEGKPVPPEVLAEYPELGKKAIDKAEESGVKYDILKNHPEYRDNPDALKIAEKAVNEVRELEGSGNVSAAPGAVVRPREAGGITTHGIGISASLVQKGRVDLRGRRARNFHEVAVLAEVFRNPQFETLRYVYVKDGKVVAHEGVTSRLPGAASIFVKNPNKEIYEINRRIERLGADGVWLVHNHPSGDPTPSLADLSLTQRMGTALGGKVKGHVVINHRKYVFIPMDGGSAVENQYGERGQDDLLTPSIEHRFLGQTIDAPSAAAAWARALYSQDDRSVILYRNAKGKIRAIQEVPVGLVKNKKALTEYIKGRKREFGSVGAIIVHKSDQVDYLSLQDLINSRVLEDSISISENRYRSAREQAPFMPVEEEPKAFKVKETPQGVEMYEVLDQTDTPEFKKWFGESKVVDEDGRPLVVYHGTPYDFTVFRKPRAGFHFGTVDQASHALTMKTGWMPTHEFARLPKMEGGQPGRMMNVYLSIRNPKTVTDQHNTRGWAKEIAKAKREGHDGLVYHNEHEGFDNVDNISYIAFSPTQIKSVYNKGTFSPENPDIRFSVRDLHRRGLLKPAKIEDVKKFFPGQEVGLDANKNIYVKTRGGKYVTLYKVDSITPDSAVLQVGYGKPQLAPGAVIPGAMGVTGAGEYYIKLHRTFADNWTLFHESFHFIETAGIINNLDVAALRGHIKRLHREGKWAPANTKDIGGPEDRANFIADRLAVKEQKGPIGRIILRIRAFIDGLLETFGIRDPESILRGIESGRIFDRKGLSTTEKSAMGYAMTSKPGAGDITANNTRTPDADTYYSGTAEGKPTGKYLYLTKNPQYAKNFGNDVMAFAASLENTLDLTAHGERAVSFEKLQAVLKKDGISITEAMREKYDDVHKPLWQWLRKYPDMMEAVKDAGYDSVRQVETFSGKGKGETTLAILDRSKVADITTKATPKPVGGGYISPSFEKYGAFDKEGNISIFHGSREPWEGEYDFSRIGNRGATQGHGAYFATDKKDARRFGKHVKELKLTRDELEAFLDGMAPLDKQSPYIQANLKSVIDRIKNPTNEDITDNATGFWKNRRHYLDFGDPVVTKIQKLTWKPKELLEYIETIEPPSYRKSIKNEIIGDPEMTGDRLYDYLVAKHWGNEKKASEFLKDRYVAGIITGRPDLFTVTGKPTVIVFDKDYISFNPARPPEGGGQYFEVLTPELPDFMKEYLTEKEAEAEKEYGAFAFDEKSTAKEGWWQLHPSGEFKNYFRKDEWPGVPKAEGVSFIIGTRNGRQEPQAIRFDRSKFDEKSASKWWAKHKRLFSTKKLWRPEAIKDIPSPKDSPKKINSWFSNETDAIVQTLLHKTPEKLPHLTFLEKILKSPEWFSHPVLSRIVKIMMSTRSEMYHEHFNYLTGNGVIEQTRALRSKGLTKADRLQGKTSKEYQLLQRFIEIGDTTWKRDKKEPLEAQIEKFEKWMRMNGATDEIINVWKLHRQSYDRALDLMTGQLRNMLAELETRAEERGETPSIAKLKQTLNFHLADMETWKGFYAPRQRTPGSWWVWAYKGPEESREYFMDFRGSEYGARRLSKQLEQDGYTISRIQEAPKLPEDIYNSIKSIDVSRAIEKATADMKSGATSEAHDELLLKFHEEVLEHVSDMIKARGFRSSMIHRRTDKIVGGYKQDPLERLTLYTNNVSRGLSKATSAKMVLNELLGEIDEETGKRIGGIDPVKEPRAYTTAEEYISEQLRNTDQSDRIIALAKSIATFKYLGFNLRSAFVNTTALATTAPPAIQQYALDGKVGFTKVMNELARASKDFGKVMVGGKLENADEQAFMEEMRKKGYDDPQYTRDALGSIMKIQHRLWGMAMDTSMYIFGKTEQWNRGTTMLAAYRLARKQGQGHEEAMEKAKLASDKAHGVYGKATLPMWAMGKNPAAKIGQMMYVYGKFSHNYLQMLYDLGVKKHNLKAFTFATLAPLVVGGMAAFPFREQIFGIFGFILKALFGEDRDPEKWVWDQIRKNFGSTAEAVGRHGVTGAMGLDISSSLSIGVGVPKGLGDLAGPAGGVWEDVTEGYRYARQGQGWRTAEKLAPRALENPLKALRESEEGATTRHGYRVWDEKGKPFKPDTGEAVSRAFGFRGTRQAVISERTNEAKREIKTFTDKKAAIYERYRAYLVSSRKDPEEHREITRKVREFNEGLKKAGVPKEEVPRITFESMRRQAQRMRKPTKQQKAMLD